MHELFGYAVPNLGFFTILGGPRVVQNFQVPAIAPMNNVEYDFLTLGREHDPAKKLKQYYVVFCQQNQGCGSGPFSAGSGSCKSEL